jgi:hypothetical protein
MNIKTTQMIKKIFLQILGAFAGVVLAYGIFLLCQVEPPPQATVLTEAAKFERVTDSTVKSLAWLVGITDTALVVRLAHWESGHYTSPIFRENHNLFGLKYYPHERSTTAIGENRGHAVYANWLMCVVDLQLYFNKYGRSLRGYSQDSAYMEKLK